MAKKSADEAGLLRAVCRRPDDDLPRLVYADWLDEHGRRERAEFIRLQVAAAGDTAWSGRWEPDQRIAELAAAHGWDWLRRDLPKWATDRYDRSAGERPEFARGFAERFRLVASPFLRFGPQLLDRTPVRAVQLCELRRVVPDLVRCVWLREVPEVDLSGEGLGDAGAVQLASAEWLYGARALDLRYNGIGDAGVRALAGCRWLTAVRDLDLWGNDLTLAGVRALAASPFLGAADRVDVGGSRHLWDARDEVVRLLGRRAG